MTNKPRIQKQIEDAEKYVDIVKNLYGAGESNAINCLVKLVYVLWEYKIGNTPIIEGFKQNSCIEKCSITGEYYYTAFFNTDIILTKDVVSNLQIKCYKIDINLSVIYVPHNSTVAFRYKFS